MDCGGRSANDFLWPEWVLSGDFAIAGEVVRDHKFSFSATFFA